MKPEIVYDRVIDLEAGGNIRFIPGEHGRMTLKPAGEEPAGPCMPFAPVLLMKETAWMLFVPSGSSGVFRNGYPAGTGEEICQGDFFQIQEYSFYYKEHHLWTQNRDDLCIQGIPYENLPDRNAYPAFHRNTRIQSNLDAAEVEILDPPPLPAGQEGNFAIRLLPSLGMLAAAGFMASKGGTAMLVFSGVSAGTGVFTAIAGSLSAGKKHRRQLRERQRTYHRYLKAKREELDKARELESALLRNHYPGPEDLLRSLFRFAPDLFERRKQDEDFLTLRLGTGNVKALKQVRYKEHEQLESLDGLSTIPEQLWREYRWLKDVPVVCDLKKTPVLGITGREPDRFGLLRNIVLDVALHQYHSDVKMIFISSQEHASRLHWLRFLPQTFLDQHHIRGIASDEESRNRIFEYIYKELSRRKEERTKRLHDDTHILIFFYDDTGFRIHPVSRFLPEAGNLGVTFLFFADRRSALVQGCDQVIDIKNPETAVMTDAADREQQVYFSFSAVSEKKAREGVLFLAPVYTQEVSLDPTLTKDYSLFQMLGIGSAEELVFGYGHAGAGQSYLRHSLSAPIGISRTGVVYLDIHDSAHGPHGLVAGTTGSGKSELLQTFILSMAVLYHPHEVGFLIIDYKGGGMAGPFAALPHLLGTITNIDGTEAGRALRSIRAELVKRQQLFEKARVNHIDRYMQLYGTTMPLPHLVIIIDEFAELKAAQPEFMKELISAARIGRSLGVHLILATQKPSGQVSEQIWSNSRFRICLKVQDTSDSKEILKSPLAAEIREAGRAYLQVGNREIFELFQAAYSSGAAEVRAQEEKEFSIYELSDTGIKTKVYQKKKPSSGSRHTQMDVVVNRIVQYCQEQNIQKLPDVFCPALAETIPYQFREEDAGRPENGLRADVGWYDDPDHQTQEVYTLNLSLRHVLIVGAERSGKTNILKAMIQDMALRYTPKQLHIYIADYASRELKQLEGLAHVGGIVCSSDREQTESLIRMLLAELEHRKRGLENGRLKAGEQAQILLVIDQLAALKELVFQDDQRLMTLCNEGLQAGIHVVAATPLASSAGYRYLTLFGEKLALHCNDSAEYHYLFDHVKEEPQDIPGRFLVQRGAVAYHGQSYLAFAEDLQEFIRRVNESYSSIGELSLPGPIPSLPEILTEKDMFRYEPPDGQDGFFLPAGITFTDIAPWYIDLAAQGALLVTGRKGNGCHNWISWMDRYLKRRYKGRYRYYVADGIHRRLSWMEGRDCVRMYSFLPEDACQVVLAVETVLEKRYQSLLQAGNKGPGDSVFESPEHFELQILLIDSPEALEAVSRNPDSMAAWRNITGRYKSLQVCPVILGIDNAPISFQAPEIMRDLRDMKNCLFFGEVKSFRLFEIPYTAARQGNAGRKPGEAWHLCGSDCTAIKTPLAIHSMSCK